MSGRSGPGAYGRIAPGAREAILALSAKGWGEAAIALKLGISTETVRRWLDPEWRERRNRMVSEARRNRAYAAPGLPPRLVDRSTLRADVAARLAEIPPDTRELTQRVLGDPIPGDARRSRAGGRGGGAVQ